MVQGIGRRKERRDRYRIRSPVFTLVYDTIIEVLDIEDGPYQLRILQISLTPS